VRDLTPEVVKTLLPDQLELLVELGDLAKKEEQLTTEIESIRRQEEKVGLQRDNRASRAVHEDSEFVELLTLRAVRERAVIREKISGLLSSLAAAGLGDLAIVARQGPNYGVDVES
jgi:hypothetical protein